jgi:molecular chaperone Hsp33
MVGTALVAEAARRHRTSPTASAAGGKHGATVQLQFRGRGPLGTVTAIADDEGRVRGYAANPTAHPPAKDGELDVASAIGRGVLAVVRQRGDGGAPYSGIVQIQAGTVAQDIAHYLAESEQNHCAVALGVFLARDEIEAAAGFSVHVLPGAEDDEIDQVEANVRGFPGPGELVRGGCDASGLAERLLDGLGSRERQRSTPLFHCVCDAGRVLRAISLLSREELAEAARESEPLEVRCHFCAEEYRVTPAQIADLLEERRA